MYWTTKTGEKILIDNMSESHAKASLKLLLNRYSQLVKTANELADKYEALRKDGFSTSETTDLFNSSFSYVLTIDEEEFDDYEEDYDI
jgi:hypothetical protein